MTIKDTCAAFLDEETGFRSLAPRTVESYSAVLRSLTEWAEGKGLSGPEELDEEALRSWARS